MKPGHSALLRVSSTGACTSDHSAAGPGIAFPDFGGSWPRVERCLVLCETIQWRTGHGRQTRIAHLVVSIGPIHPPGYNQFMAVYLSIVTCNRKHFHYDG